MLRVVRRLPVEYVRALTGLRLGAGVLQPLTKVPVQEPRTSGVFFVPGMTGVGRKCSLHND